MSSATEGWKQWEGQLVDGKFPLRRWLANSDHSAVFLTEGPGPNAPQTVIKLIPEDHDVNARVSLWADAAKLSHPHLIRLLGQGRCTIDGTPVLYVVMEYAEENLDEIIPVRALSPDEALEMLRPAAEALAFLHRSGFVHSRIKPANILAVGDKLKLSSDGLCRPGQIQDTKLSTAYGAPEVSTSGFSAASDIWSLGTTLVLALTQTKPNNKRTDNELDAALQRVPDRLRRIVLQCLQNDPAKRPSAAGILQELSGQPIRGEAATNTNLAPSVRQHQLARQIVMPVVVVVAVLVAILIASRAIHHEPSSPVSQTQSQTSQPDTSATSSTAPAAKSLAHSGVVPGSVLNRVMPDVSPGARHTITGHIKISVEVNVDTAGNVSNTRLKTAGPSMYFSSRALAAARQWKFTPPQVNGNSVPSEWLLRFQFSRSGVQVSPGELKP
jgi:TonB family protein